MDQLPLELSKSVRHRSFLLFVGQDRPGGPDGPVREAPYASHKKRHSASATPEADP